MDILYSADQCGAGKTKWALDRLASKPGRYVLVVDRQLMAETRLQEIQDRAALLGTTPHVEIVSSDGVAKTLGGVGTRIPDAGLRASSKPHVVVIITHAGLTLARRWEAFKLWDAIIIDEAPSLLDREEYAACPFEAGGLSKFYNLAPTEEEGVSRIIHKRGFPEPPERWRKFHQLALTGEAKCDLTSWDDLDHREEGWSAWRLWDVLKLDGVFGEVIFLADAFDQSEAFALMSLSKGVRFQSFRVAAPRVWAPRPVTIRYVSEDRRASTSWFKDDRNARDMAKVWDWLALETAPDHLWTSNAGVNATADIIGRKVTPRQAGSNEWMSWHRASMIYAARPSPSERKFYTALGIDPAVIETSREGNDMVQFFMRTSLRDPASTAPVVLRCFDRTQAEFIAAKLADGYGLMAALDFDDIGLDLKVRKGGRPPSNGRARMTPEERRVANAAAQQKRRDAKKKAA